MADIGAPRRVITVPDREPVSVPREPARPATVPSTPATRVRVGAESA